ncbi:hypothetical protein AQI95_10785 [Streptomyces yokosukanensis]|uniref:Uncharacterized protein n=1 Tax=Streptomyces yokosukanensis TaxID=67386 RepID=A0A117Q4B3_9ACTN|nr:DUF6177 family protein [Streptomyces yokosukanensis]KUN07498.1 hypothetical protein AQI95_10785 [Streptomyces yokosukanensis]
MTHDVVAVTPKGPDARTMLAGLYAGGSDLRVDRVSDGAAVQLCTADGQPLVTVEVPVFIQVPGEVGRLLGPDVRAEAPVWWTEVRATTAVAEAGRLAGSVGGRIAAVLGGTTWPADAAHTDVVPIPSTGGRSPDSGALGVDVLTDQAALVIQDRPVIAATTWLTDLLQTTVPSGRELQIVTPPRTRLTLPTRSLMTNVPARWVVLDPACGYYDGLTGAVLHWHEGRFAPVPTADGRASVADAFEAGAATQGEQQLHLSIRTTHPADENLLLGGALEAVWQALTGDVPTGWSTAEPVNLPWSRRQLTELARARAEKSAPTWLVAVGAPDRPGIATCRVVRTPAGVEEQITLAFGYTDGQAPLHSLAELAETLATRHRLTSMLTYLRTARADLTTPPHREAPLVPLSFTLGCDAVRLVGSAVAESAPGCRPVRLGPMARPALHYPLGDGADLSSWQRLKQLDDHLKACR